MKKVGKTTNQNIMSRRSETASEKHMRNLVRKGVIAPPGVFYPTTAHRKKK